MRKLANKVALVTGSSRGIGAAIAIQFAQAGAQVAVHGRDVAALAAGRAEIEAAGGQALQGTADVTPVSENEATRQQGEGGLGPLDILGAKAGGAFARPGAP